MCIDKTINQVIHDVIVGANPWKNGGYTENITCIGGKITTNCV